MIRYGEILQRGEKFGMLTPMSFEGINLDKRQIWRFMCDCGNEVILDGYRVFRGSPKSCGCLVKKRLTTHGHAGHTRSPEYQSWSGMHNRCKNQTHINYHMYGARGITVCDRWKKFENFLEDMGARPSGMSLERIDSNGNYDPGNCRWATIGEQARNTRRMANSGIHGISWNAGKNHWQIRIVENRKHILCTARKNLFDACCVLKSFLAKENRNV